MIANASASLGKSALKPTDRFRSMNGPKSIGERGKTPADPARASNLADPQAT
jgi:hypothetical protein